MPPIVWRTFGRVLPVLAAAFILAFPFPAPAQGSTTYYFPHLAVGASWQTTLTYINYSPQQVSCQTDFISDHGSPLQAQTSAIHTFEFKEDT